MTHLRQSGKRLVFLVASSLCLLLLAGGCANAPKVYEPTDKMKSEQVSHEAWDGILKRHVGNGRVDYTGIRDLDRKTLDSYLDMIAHTDPSAFGSDREEKAFWINAYNAFAVQSVLEGYSPSNLWGRYRFFCPSRHIVGGRKVGLWTIERKILPTRFEDPRIYFALVGAARGYPQLRDRAYTAENLDAMLDETVRDFVSDDTCNHISRRKETLYLSKIFSWHENQIVGDFSTVKTFFLGHLEAPIEVKKPWRTYRVVYADFDWNLNGPPVEKR